MAVIAILGVLSGTGWARLMTALDHAKVARAIGDLGTISRELASMDTLPQSLADIRRGGLLDPWGHPYQYLPFTPGEAPPGEARLDRFLVTINTRYDLYSLGPDGLSSPAFTGIYGLDDIVVGSDGGFIGRAAEY